jgi:recombination protein RecA
VQKKGGLAVCLDTENAANPAFMKAVGVDLEKLVYAQPGTTEEVFETIEKVIGIARAKDVTKPVVIVWDSVAATPSQAEIEGDFNPTGQVGLMARAISKGLRKLTQVVGKDKITLLFANQVKMKIGVTYGDPWVTPGGKAIPYHASIRIRLTQSTKNKDADGDVISIHTNAKCIKTRFGPPLRKCAFNIFFDRGIEDVESWRDMLHEAKVISKANGFMFMQNVPQTVEVADEKGNPVQKVEITPELKFRERSWKDRILGDEAFKKHVLSLVEKHMIVTYDTEQLDIDAPDPVVQGGDDDYPQE